MPSWVEHAVWWHVYPLGFVGADTSGADRSPRRTLDDLVGWLDYAVELGASGLALGPIFSSGSHGYDTTDYFAIDERLGDEAAFARLVAGCRERGLRLLLDGVFNHVGRGFPAFARVVAGQAQDGEDRLFLPAPDDGTHPDEPAYSTFERHPGLITLNHAEPAVADLVVSVMRHWLRAGADGWRLDAAYAVPREFWASVLPRVRSEHPDAYFVGEVIHGDYAGIVRDSGIDALTQYELWKAIWSSIGDRNFFELAWAIERHVALLDTFVPFTFIGNHDVTRIASRIEDERHHAHAVVLLCTLAGTPAVYYGDEQAFRAVKEDRVGGDDAVRPEFPAAGPASLAPTGRATYRLHQLLIGFRRRHPWLHRANTTPVRLTNTFFAYASERESQHIVVALNLSDTEESVDVPADLSEVLHDPDGAPAALRDGVLRTPPHGWAIAY